MFFRFFGAFGANFHAFVGFPAPSAPISVCIVELFGTFGTDFPNSVFFIFSVQISDCMLGSSAPISLCTFRFVGAFGTFVYAFFVFRRQSVLSRFFGAFFPMYLLVLRCRFRYSLFRPGWRRSDVVSAAVGADRRGSVVAVGGGRRPVAVSSGRCRPQKGLGNYACHASRTPPYAYAWRGDPPPGCVRSIHLTHAGPRTPPPGSEI